MRVVERQVASMSDTAFRYGQGSARVPGGVASIFDLPRWRVTLAAWLAIPVAVYAMAFPMLRPLNEAPLLVVVIAAAGAALLMERVIARPAQWALIAFSTLWLVLSLTRSLPSGWTRYFDAYAAVRHWVWVLLVPLFVTSFVAFWSRYGSFVVRRALMIAAGYFIVSRLAMWIAGVDTSFIFSLYGVNNTTLPILFLLILFLLRRQRVWFMDLIFGLAILALCTSATNSVIALSVLAVRFAPTPRLIPAGLAVVLIMALILSPNFALELFRLDANSGVRAVMWRDAAAAAVESHGLGVGYGTEYIKNQWGSIQQDWTLRTETSQDRLFVSTHSAFYDVLLRTGYVGVALLMFWMSTYGRTPSSLGIREARVRGAAACLIYTAISFNPGLTAIDVVVAISMVLGYLELQGLAHESERLAQRRIHRLLNSDQKRSTAGRKTGVLVTKRSGEAEMG